MRPLPSPSTEPTVSVEEAAGWLGLGRSAAYECARRGELPVIRLGRRLRVPTAGLRALLSMDDGHEGRDPCSVSPIRRTGA